jgi:hypothetical protein
MWYQTIPQIWGMMILLGLLESGRRGRGHASVSAVVPYRSSEWMIRYPTPAPLPGCLSGSVLGAMRDFSMFLICL